MKSVKFARITKCDTETQSEWMLLEKMTWIDLLKAGLPQTFRSQSIYKVQYSQAQ